MYGSLLRTVFFLNDLIHESGAFIVVFKDDGPVIYN